MNIRIITGKLLLDSQGSPIGLKVMFFNNAIVSHIATAIRVAYENLTAATRAVIMTADFFSAASFRLHAYCHVLCDKNLRHGKKHPGYREWNSCSGERQSKSESRNGGKEFQ